MRRVLRWVGTVLGVLVGLILLAVGGALIAVNTDWGREQVRRQVEKQLDNMVTGDVELGPIKGSVLRSFTIDGIVVRDAEKREVVRADSLTINYDLFSLIKRRVIADEIILEHPIVSAVRDPDGKLNVAKLYKQPAQKGPSQWVIQLKAVRVRNGLVVLPLAGGRVSIANLGLDAKLDVGTTTKRADLARIAGIWLERGLPIEAHGNVVQSDLLVAVSGLEVVAGKSRVGVPLGFYRPDAGGAVAALDVVAREPDVFIFWPHDLALGDATIGGVVARAAADRPVEARLVSRALGGEIKLAATVQPDPAQPQARGELRVRGLRSPLERAPAEVNVDAAFELAGRSLATARGTLDVNANGTVMRRKIESLKLAAVFGGGVARTDVSATLPAAQATLHADLRLAQKPADLVVEAARLHLEVSDVGQLAARPGVHGDLDLAVEGQGTLRELSVKGKAHSGRVTVGTNRASDVGVLFDLRGAPRDPKGVVNIDATRVVAGKTPLGRVHARAHLPGGRIADLTAAVIGKNLPYSGRAAARVSLLDDVTSIRLQSLDVLARGLRVRGAPGGSVALKKNGQIAARDLAFSSESGSVEIEGDLAREHVGGRTGALPSGKMHVHVRGLDVGKMRNRFAPDMRPIAGVVTADIHLLRDGRQLGFEGDIVGTNLVSGDPRLPPIDLTTRFSVGHGKLMATGHTRAPPGQKSAGVIDFALAAKVPRNLLDKRAWKQVELDEALSGARITLRDIDLGVLGAFMGRRDIEGRVDGSLVSAPGARAVDVNVELHGLTTPDARGIDGKLEGRWGHEDLSLKLFVSTGGVEIVHGDAKVAAGLHALLAGADLPNVPIRATLGADDVPIERLRTAFPSLGRRASGKLSLAAEVTGTMSRPKATAAMHVADARLARVDFKELSARANLDRARIDATITALQKAGGKLEASALVNRAAGNLLNARITANKFDLAFLPVVARKKTDLLAGAGGKLDADLSLGGRVAGPRSATGTLAIHDGQIYTPSGMAGLVQKIELAARIENGRVVIDTLRGQSGSGTLNGQAEVQLAATLLPRSFTAKLSARHFPVSAGSMVVSASTDVEAAGRATEDMWDIEATLRHTTIRVPEERRSGEKVQQVGPLADVVYVDTPDFQRQTAFLALTGTTEAQQGGPNIRLRLKTPGGVRVSGRELDILLNTNLAVYYHDAEPFVGGVVEANRGFIELFKRRYDVLRANASFDENQRINPRLDIRLAHEFRTTTVYIHVGGTQEQPTMELSADPGQYDQAELLGWVLGGDPDDPAVGKRPLGNEAVGMASNMVLGQVQQLVKTALPIDVLSVRVGEGSDTQTTRFEVGKWLSENLFLGYIYRLNAPDDKNLNEAEIQYRIGARWLLDAFFGDRGVAGADIIWSKKY